MKLGVCYYPEQWPPAQWPDDARRMRAAGLDLVRVAEFAWARLEPVEGRYDWRWLDEAVRLLAEAGLAVLLGTPTAAPPAWLTREHPEVLRVDHTGRRRAHGSRRHTCPSNPVYRAYCRGITQAMAGRYGQDARVVGWQIDNEFGGGGSARCFCPACRAAFRHWLEQRYVTLERLNEAWGTVFWSQTYDDWAAIDLPDDRLDKPNPSQALDALRFATAVQADFQQEQLAILREQAPDRPVTTNFMGLFAELNPFELARPLDFATWDSYPTGNPDRWRAWLYPPGADTSQNDPTYAYDVGDPVITGLAHALTYGLKRAPFWIMEQQSGHINWGTINPGIRPGTIRLWTWHAVASGADAVLFFRWRAGRLAQEQYHAGLLHHDGRPDVGYGDLLRLQAERPILQGLISASSPTGAALLVRWDDIWALSLQPHRRGFHFFRLLFLYFAALQRLGLPASVAAVGDDLSNFPLVIAPSAHIVDQDLARDLTRYVDQGGRLLLGIRSGFKQPDNRVTGGPLPGALRNLVGTTVSDWAALPDGVEAPVVSDIAGLGGGARWWRESLAPETATTLAHYGGGGAPALVENRLGQGRAYYLAWYPSPDQTQALLRHLALQAGLRPVDGLPAGILQLRRGEYRVLLNFTDQNQSLSLDGQTVIIPARDLVVLPG